LGCVRKRKGSGESGRKRGERGERVTFANT
jgi:hypothetical protein